MGIDGNRNRLGLREAKKLFFDLRELRRVDVCEEHVIVDHKERGYSLEEVVNLILARSGRFEDTTDPQFQGLRFYWRTKDSDNKSVRLVVEFDCDKDGQLILVVSAGERK
jgi:hypothetical protein